MIMPETSVGHPPLAETGGYEDPVRPGSEPTDERQPVCTLIVLRRPPILQRTRIEPVLRPPLQVGVALRGVVVLTNLVALAADDDPAVRR
jgi:hypothetical protein